MRLSKNNIVKVETSVVHGFYNNWFAFLKDGSMWYRFVTVKKGVSKMSSIEPDELPKSIQEFIKTHDCVRSFSPDSKSYLARWK